jgi:tRNA wybutosine-synthesizing protein 1
MKKFEESNGEATFTSLDYMEETPSWAVFGDSHRGFDPNETRWMRKGKKKDLSGC